MKCAYCNKEIVERKGIDTCSDECMWETFSRRYNNFNTRPGNTVEEIFEYFVNSVLCIWATNEEARFAEEIIANHEGMRRLKECANHPVNQTSWGAVLREAGRRRFGNS